MKMFLERWLSLERKKKAVQTKFCFKYNINSLKLKYQDMQYSGVMRYLQGVNLQPCNTVE